MSGSQSRIRDRLAEPRLWIVFALAGIAMATISAWRLTIGIPAADAMFPAKGLLRFEAGLLLAGGSTVETTPGMVLGLKPQFLAVLVGHWALGQVVLTLGVAVTCTMLLQGGWRPSLRVTMWLLTYTVVGGVLLFGAVMLLPRSVFWVAVVITIPLSIVLFLTPAVIVTERTNPIDGMRRASGLFFDRPLRTTGAVLGVSYLGYLASGTTLLFGTESVLGYAAGQGVTTTVGGALYVSVLLTSYERAKQELAFGAPRAPSSKTDVADTDD